MVAFFVITCSTECPLFGKYQMPLPKTYKKALYKAINMEEPNKDKLYQFLLKISEKNTDFVKRLKLFLDCKATLETKALAPANLDQYSQGRKATEPLAQYSPQKKAIEINKELLDLWDLTNKVDAIVETVFRHELTHAFDYLQLLEKGQSIAVKRLQGVSVYANDLFNALHAVFRKKKINRAALDNLQQLFEGSFSERIVSISIEKIGQEAVYNGNTQRQMYDKSLADFGFVVHSNGRSILEKNYITEILPLESVHTVFYVTSNLATIESIYNKIAPHYSPAAQKYWQEYFVEDFNSGFLSLWKNLTETQQQTLDSLIRIYQDLFSQVIGDKVCYPALLQCRDALGQDCLNDFIFCQANSNPSFMLRSMLEIHAVLNQYTLFRPEILARLSDLSSNQIVKTVNMNTNQKISPTKPAEVHKKITMTSPSELNMNADRTFYGGKYFSCFMTSLMVGFSETLVSHLLQRTKLSYWKQYLCKGLFSVFLLSVIGFAPSDIIYMKSLTMLLESTTAYFKISVLEPFVAFWATTVGFLGVYFSDDYDYGNYGIVEFGYSLAGGTLGFFCANGLNKLGNYFYSNNDSSTDVTQEKKMR